MDGAVCHTPGVQVGVGVAEPATVGVAVGVPVTVGVPVGVGLAQPMPVTTLISTEVMVVEPL
ncbi:MAG: hypothetical protein DMF11_13530 [Verrucomicrobia bacterium]|nr:MAG: hypothetical protein DMF11_13530 [Verrucomicrobiota bacterium]